MPVNLPHVHTKTESEKYLKPKKVFITNKFNKEMIELVEDYYGIPA